MNFAEDNGPPMRDFKPAYLCNNALEGHKEKSKIFIERGRGAIENSDYLRCPQQRHPALLLQTKQLAKCCNHYFSIVFRQSPSLSYYQLIIQRKQLHPHH